jgi:hypothetical protein
MKNNYSRKKSYVRSISVFESDRRLSSQFNIEEDEYDKYCQELRKAEDEHKQLLEDFKEYENKTILREKELRNYLKTLTEKFKYKDINVLKYKFNSLHSQIQNSIHELEFKTKDDIISCKNEINSRSQLRIMDSEAKYLTNLNIKSKEQEGFVNQIKECIYDMERVKMDYEKVKNIVETFLKRNFEYKSIIDQLEMENAKIKIEISHYTKRMNYMKLKLANKLANKISKPVIVDKNNLNNKDEKSVVSRFKKKEEVNMEIITELLYSEEFLKNYPRASGTISSLANILENSKIKLNKLQKETENHKLNSNMIQRLYDVIFESKANSLNKTDKILKMRSEGLISKNINIIKMSKEDRYIFVENLVKNPKITELVEKNIFPNLVLLQRKISNK